MTSITEEVEILKQDLRGRVLVPKERREALLEEFEKSGLSGAQFARMAGVKYPTFANWIAGRRREKALSAPGLAVRLLEAEVDDLAKEATDAESAPRRSLCAAGLLVELPGGSRLRVESPVQLGLAAELIKLVGQNRSREC